MTYELTNQYTLINETEGVLQNKTNNTIEIISSEGNPTARVTGLSIKSNEKFKFKAQDGKRLYARCSNYNTSAIIVVEDCVNFKQPASGESSGAGCTIDDAVVTTSKTWSSKKIYKAISEAGFDPVEINELLNTKLPLSGGAMTGDITQPIAPTINEHLANKNYVDTTIAALIGSAPGTLDTLGKLAEALADDDNMSATLLALIGDKLDAKEVVTTPAPNKVLRTNTDGNLPANITGNASTATRLKNPVNINGQAWHGDTDINITSDAKIDDWQPNQPYSKNALVVQNNIIYRAATSHTSSNFVEDLNERRWEAIGNATGSGSGSSDYAQITKLNVTATAANPKLVEVQIQNTTSFCLPPVEVLKFTPGPQDVITTVCAFDNADATDFVVDGESGEVAKYVAFDGVMKPRTEFEINVSEPVPLEDGYISESEEIDFANYKKVVGVI